MVSDIASCGRSCGGRSRACDLPRVPWHYEPGEPAGHTRCPRRVGGPNATELTIPFEVASALGSTEGGGVNRRCVKNALPVQPHPGPDPTTEWLAALISISIPALCAAVLLMLPLSGSTPAAASLDQVPYGYTRDIHQFRGVIVDSLVIDNRNIYDTESPEYRHFVFKLANRLHYKTHQSIIKWEMLVQVGREFVPELADETTRNLRRRLALFDAWIEAARLPNGRLVVKVVTIDEWSLSGGLNLSRDGNETRYEFSIAERNLLGRNQLLSADYVVQSDDDDYLVARFSDPRFLGSPHTVGLGFGDDPMNTFRYLEFGHPFYSLLQNYSFNVTLGTVGGRREIHNGRVLIGQWSAEGDYAGVDGAYRLGTYHQKIQFSAELDYRYETVSATAIDTADSENRALALAGLPDDSLYYQIGAGIQLSNLNFAALKRIDGFGYTEDFTLGQSLMLTYGRAFDKEFRDHHFDVFDIGVSQGYHFGCNLAFLTYRRTLWFRGDRDIRRLVWMTANYVSQPIPFLTLASRAQYLSDSRANGAEDIVLGGKNDLRGFDQFFRTGDRKAAVSLEGRLFPDLSLLSVLFLPAVFLDGARAWKTEEKFTLRGFYFSVGMGLRVAIERSAKNRLIRIDVAYSEHNGWQLSIGTDQYFQSQESGFLLTTP